MRTTESIRPEALADVPGDAEYNLTRAVVVYRERHLYWEQEAQALSDLGVGLVIDGSFPLAAEVVDLGSGRAHTLDLSTQVAVLDWVTEKTVAHVRHLRARELSRERAWPGSSAVQTFCETLLMEVLRRAGFTALTRPVLLRLGFRDVVRDLDVNEAAVVRVKLTSGALLTLSLDAENAALVVDGATGAELRDVHRTVRDAIAEAIIDTPDTRDTSLEVRFALPRGLEEVYTLVESCARAVLQLYAQHEPQRFQQISELLGIVGRRDTLGRLSALDARAPDRIRLAS